MVRRPLVLAVVLAFAIGGLAGGTATAAAGDPCDKVFTKNSIARLKAYTACRDNRQDAALKRIEARLAKLQTVPATPPSSSSPTPSPAPSTTAPPAPPSSPPTSAGARFPDASSTGVPVGTRLSAYSGSLTITKDGAVIDAKTVDGDLVIRAAHVKITRSKINGTVATDENSKGYSFDIEDSTVDVGSRSGTGVGAVNFTATRVHVTGGNRSMHCWHDCTISDSYVHGQFRDSTGQTHESGIRMGARAVIRHNTIICDAPDVPPDAGCSAGLTGYGDFATVEDNLVENNFFGATTGGFCAYGGSTTTGKAYGQGRNIRFIDNMFERGRENDHGVPDCGYYGAVTGFAPSRGNVFNAGNVYDDGTRVTPGGP